ncbi:hypothetical protein RFI_06518 [Reticulomyxa filosa]|uniref:VWFA domain-containing protein n=1 Tax=Reticulomyxa filosa TaxID=46433 RepID=X6NXJ3_RETFI|nr:hypothetical protein RFI_06518 [Reticulomyxa filosa]|eukprot:ETO30603.1 hypothetical protein RFI_06518 [Reticulomyxa filosa]
MITGVLMDVSGSMKSKLNLDAVKFDKEEVTRAQTVFNTIFDLIKEDNSFRRADEKMFALAFGLVNEEVRFCDLITLLDCLEPVCDINTCRSLLAKYNIKNVSSYIKRCDNSQMHRIVGHEPLIQMVIEGGAPYCRQYIQEHLSEEDAGFLFVNFAKRSDSLPKVIQELPYACKYGVLSVATKVVVPKSEEKRIASKIVKMAQDSLLWDQKKKARSREEVIAVIDKLSLRYGSFSKPFSSEQLRKLLADINPYIYGQTPMCETLRFTQKMFEVHSKEGQIKVLLIISDGDATDGDPVPLAKSIRNSGVTIISCLLTEEQTLKPKILYDKEDEKWYEQHAKCLP